MLQRTYYWIYGNHNGRLFVLGCKSSEEEANQFGYEKLEIPFDVIGLPTKDRGRATSMIKARVLDNTADIDYSLQRASHTIKRKPVPHKKKWYEVE